METFKTESRNDLRDIYHNEVSDEFSKAMLDEANLELMMTILASSGWYSVKLKRIPLSEDFYLWIEDNIKNTYHQLNDHFVFAEEKDANWFKMRWL